MSQATPKSKAVRFKLTLFVVANDPNSMLAEENLRHVCQEYLRGDSCTVTIVDVWEQFQAALDQDVLVTPTLIVDGPRGRSTILGNLSDIDRIMLTLGSKS